MSKKRETKSNVEHKRPADDAGRNRGAVRKGAKADPAKAGPGPARLPGAGGKPGQGKKAGNRQGKGRDDGGDLGKARGKGKPGPAPKPEGGKLAPKPGRKRQARDATQAALKAVDAAQEAAQRALDAGKALTVAEQLIAEAEAEFRGIELPRSLPKRGDNPHLGRPMEYNSHVLAEILEQVAAGEPLARICRERGNRPNYTTVMRWAELSRRIMIALARARVEGHALLELSMLEIADESRNDFVETEKGIRYNPEAVQRSKLRIETREKLLKVWNSERWHDVLRVQHDHRGMPVAAAGPGGTTEGGPKPMSEYTTDELLAFLERAAAEEASTNAGESDEHEE